MFDPFFIVFFGLGFLIVVLCYRAHKESERTWERNDDFMHRDGKRPHGERRF